MRWTARVSAASSNRYGVAFGSGWLVVHPDMRNVPRIRVTIDALISMFRADPIVL